VRRYHSSLPVGVLLCALTATSAWCQITGEPDTAEVAEVTPAAALLIDLHRQLDQPALGGAGFEYTADTFIDYVEGDSILLRGHAVVLHRGARLEAGELVYHRTAKTMEARPLVDSTGTAVGMPTFRRGDDVVRGENILYDTDSGSGIVRGGQVEFKDAFYTGRHIHILSEDEFRIHAGAYTTCDLPEPHFDFYSPSIKVLPGDMAIARPIYVRIAGRRVLWIPFFVFSLREDRQSGILTPGFGRRPLSFGDSQTEWEVKNLGYYFAPSDYWDLTLAADLRQRTGWLTRAALAYAWRYHFDGRIETRLQNRRSGRNVEWEWWTNVRHSQELSPSASVRASGTFQSSKDFLRDNSTTLSESLNRTLRSNLRLDQRWREAGYSLSVTASQTENLDTDRSDAVLPEISLRSNRKALRARPKGSRSTDGPWYTRVYYQGSTRLRNTRSTVSGQTTSRTRADLSFRLSSQQRPVSWLNVSSGLSETWQDADLRRSDARNEGVRTDGINVSASLSQTLYGMFHPDLGRLTALRHVLKPDAGLSYSATRTDTGGVLGVGGRGSSWRQSRRLTLRLGNTFWAKVLDDETEKKVRLAQLNLSTSYDFDARRQWLSGKRRPLADLVSSLSVEAGRRLNSRVSLRSEFYDSADQLLLPPRIRQFEISTTARFARGPSGRGDDSDSARRSTGGDYSQDASRYSPSSPGQSFGYESGLQGDIDRSAGRRSLQLSHYYLRRRGSPSRSWVRGSATATWRRVWHLHYSVNANLRAPGIALLSADRVTAELLSVQREFHDWTATVNVEPSRVARDRAFYFKAQLKDIPQIRFERGDHRRVRR